MQIIKIGKSKSNHIYVELKNDPTVSRNHCQIFIDDEGNKFLTDLDSTNGTFVNENKISNPVKLNDLDIVRAGNSLVKWKDYLMNNKVSVSTPQQRIYSEEFFVNSTLFWILIGFLLLIYFVVFIIFMFNFNYYNF